MKHKSLYHVVQEQRELKAMISKMFIKTFINLKLLINNDLKRKQRHLINESCLLSVIITFKNTIIVIVIVIHTLLWHRFRLDPWETLCYFYRVNKTLWGRKPLAVYTTASRSRNSEFWDYVPNLFALIAR